MPRGRAEWGGAGARAREAEGARAAHGAAAAAIVGAAGECGGRDREWDRDRHRPRAGTRHRHTATPRARPPRPRGPAPSPPRGAAAGRAGREPPSRAALTFPVFEAPAARSRRGGGRGSRAIAGCARDRRAPRVGGLRGERGASAGASSALRLGGRSLRRGEWGGAGCASPRPAGSPRRFLGCRPRPCPQRHRGFSAWCPSLLLFLFHGSVSRGGELKGANRELRGDGLLGFNVLAVFCLARRL